MQGRNGLYLAASSILAATVLSVFLHSSLTSPSFYSDFGSFWGRDWVRSGLVPNLSPDTFFEYPPIAGYLVYLARALGGSYNGYYAVFSALNLGTAVGIAWSSWRLAKTLGRELNPVYFILPSVVVYGLYSFDLFNAFLIVLSLQFFLEGKRTASGVALALAVSTKLVGVFLLPVFLLDMSGSRERTKYLFVVMVVVLLSYAPTLVLNFGYVYQFLGFFRTWGLEDAWYVWIFQSPATWGYAKLFGFAVIGLLLALVYSRKVEVVSKSFLALSAYLLGTYIYAPQFSLMLIPLVAVLDLRNPSVYLWDASNALIILTWFVQPTPMIVGACPLGQTWCPTYAGSPSQAVALVRSGMLALMFALLLRPSVNWLSPRLRFGRRSVGRPAELR